MRGQKSCQQMTNYTTQRDSVVVAPEPRAGVAERQTWGSNINWHRPYSVHLGFQRLPFRGRLQTKSL